MLKRKIVICWRIDHVMNSETKFYLVINNPVPHLISSITSKQFITTVCTSIPKFLAKVIMKEWHSYIRKF